MEAPDVPLENTQEHIKEHARESEERWVMGVALSTAVLAAVAAVASLLAGQHINEGLISEIRASDHWAYYQAKGIKSGVLEAKMELLKAEGKEAGAADIAREAKYAQEQSELEKEAQALTRESDEHIERHEKLASAVTFFQIGIAISAIAVLTRKRLFWLVGMGFGAAGLVFLVVAYR